MAEKEDVLFWVSADINKQWEVAPELSPSQTGVGVYNEKS